MVGPIGVPLSNISIPSDMSELNVLTMPSLKRAAFVTSAIRNVDTMARQNLRSKKGPLEVEGLT